MAEKKYFYPDVTVSCAPEDRQRGVDIIRTPRLVVEVLSPTTETNDRVQKFRFYKACPSIQEYVLISTQYQEVEIYHRQAVCMEYQLVFAPGLEIAPADFVAAWNEEVSTQEEEPGFTLKLRICPHLLARKSRELNCEL